MSVPSRPDKKKVKVPVWLWVVGGLAVLLILAGLNSNGTTSNGNDATATLDRHTCEIAVDIARSFGVTETLAESRERVVDLYQGYGQGTSSQLQAGLRNWSAGLTQGDLELAAEGVAAVTAACKAIG